MGEETLDRKEFIGRIGTFFMLIGLFALMIFIGTDISRSNRNQLAKQTDAAYAAQALQTRDAGAKSALLQNLPTPTLVPVDELRKTQEIVEFGVQALQTRDVGAQRALLLDLPTPTLIPAQALIDKSEGLNYLGLFCIGVIAISGGLILRRLMAPPKKPSGRFEGLRKMRQRQREAQEKREAAQKEKEAKKKR